jgi:hypothetical protein
VFADAIVNIVDQVRGDSPRDLGREIDRHECRCPPTRRQGSSALAPRLARARSRKAPDWSLSSLSAPPRRRSRCRATAFWRDLLSRLSIGYGIGSPYTKSRLVARSWGVAMLVQSVRGARVVDQNQVQGSHYPRFLPSAEMTAAVSDCILARPPQYTFNWIWSWENVYQVSARGSPLGPRNVRAK